MILKNILILFIASLLIVSCAKTTKRKSVNYSGVDVTAKGNDKLLPDIKNNQTQLGAVGPFPPMDGQAYANNQSKTKAFSLVLGPGINRVLCHIPLLKEMKIQSRPIHILTGTGMGAVVASLYASGVTPDKIEWLFYNFSKKVKSVKPYSKKWVNAAVEILLKSLKNKKIQNTEIGLALPVYDSKTRKVRYITRGLITPILINEHLELNKINQSNRFAPYQKEVFNPIEIKALGADLVVGVDVLNQNINFETTDHYLTGVFGRITGIITREKEDLDFFIEMDSRAMPLDSNKSLPSYMQNCMNRSRQKVKELKTALDSTATESTGVETNN